jgi:hypothetical protein
VQQLNGLATKDPEFRAAAVAVWVFTVLDVGHTVIEFRSELAMPREASHEN